ncbi:hypothetical protein J2T61_001145 [Methanocalculus sp. AMF5]|uniref:hypothetical protein n=1 Tax=Methanocalculus sp. AMF5 TaxID=1198257 RepID=UPI0020A211B4|nr:hypothetical protein [Methanocalculus sp. AMF5]MCP1662465.1 hypothetical protein [Methanocalculus sp. AMF5]
MSEISKIYGQYQTSLKNSQMEYEDRIHYYAKEIQKRHDLLLKNHIISYSNYFSNQINRIELKNLAEKFFETSDIPFVAIDASCHKQQSSDFLSIYGGAYGSKGTVSLSSGEGKIKYQRWEMNKDVSMVAFVPIPPDVMHVEDDDSDDVPQVLSDTEVGELSSLHTKIMQLAEIYLAYSLANSGIDRPRLILIDNSISGIMGNTSFSPDRVKMIKGDFDGESLSKADLQIALAHPINLSMNVPSSKRFQPHFRLIAEATEQSKKTISQNDIKDFAFFKEGATTLQDLGAGTYNEQIKSFTFQIDPRRSWSKTKVIFENICEKLFRDKDPNAMMYKLSNKDKQEYFTVRDIVFLTGVGIRALIELCWRRKILLIGVVKDSSTKFWYRNYLGTFCHREKQDVIDHYKIPLTDRSIIELLPNIDTSILAPWGTVEFDSCFMTLHAEKEANEDKWTVKGYHTARGLEVTRPERLFLRSLMQFFLSEDKNIVSHAIFIDRLAYPGWDDKDALEFNIETSFGIMKPLLYTSNEKIPRLQLLSMYLMSVLVRNHFPEALGYPDPLHQADWGAKSLKKNVLGLLKSSEWAFKSRPLSKTFRNIRESFGR